jgi:hypothetical protein
MATELYEFRCKCGVEYRLHYETIAFADAGALPLGGKMPSGASPLGEGGVKHCASGKGVMPRGIPVSLDVKRKDGTWAENARYR